MNKKAIDKRIFKEDFTMGKTIFIPEGYLMFFAAGHQAQRKVKLSNFNRLKAIISKAIKDSFLGKVVFTENKMIGQYFYIENDEIITYPNSEYEKLFYQYKNEMIKNIESTYGVNYFYAAGVLEDAKQKWKKRI